MSRKVTSVRGVVVDFDLLAIKGQMSAKPKTETTKVRERFIDKKRRRTTRNTIEQVLSQQKQNEANVRAAMLAPKDAITETSAPIIEENPMETAFDTSEAQATEPQVVNKIIKK
jgi:hypothetical protein